MDFLTIEELAILCGISERSLNRKLKEFKIDSPELFLTLCRKQTGQSRRLLYSKDIITHLGMMPATAMMKQVIEELREAAASKPAPEKKQKVKKDKYRTRDHLYNTDMEESAPQQVVYLDAMDRNEESEIAIFNLILNDYKTGKYRFDECIIMHQADFNQVWAWINHRPRFKALYDICLRAHKVAFYETLKDHARQSLMRMITGYDKQTEVVNYQQMVSPSGAIVQIPKERRTQIKHVLPNVNAIMFALTNRDSEEWKRVFGSRDKDIPPPDNLENMSDADLMKFLDDAKNNGLLGNSQEMV